MSEKGKNFSANNVSGKRHKSDFYETPYSLTRQLLEHEFIPEYTPIVDPASGNGAIVKVLKEKFKWSRGTDLKHGIDFLETQVPEKWIITNPPFNKALEFILHAKEISQNFAFLLPLAYLHGKKRYDKVWTDQRFPLRTVYVFSRYPMLGEPLREDGKYHTGMMVYAWFVWKKRQPDEEGFIDPVLKFIDNNSFVISTKDE